MNWRGFLLICLSLEFSLIFLFVNSCTNTLNNHKQNEYQTTRLLNDIFETKHR